MTVRTLSLNLAGSCLLIFLLVACAAQKPHEAGTMLEQPTVFETMDGQTVDAFEGNFLVPENRNQPDSRQIPIRYVRFPATTDNPGPPIIYLAGGPGGSGIATAKYPNFRFPLFMALRQHGDVIALDQRGTGDASTLPKCISSAALDTAQPVSDQDVTRITRLAAQQCMDYWQTQGINVAGYNSLESARDINDLRQRLKADKVILWGISYGSHLALASLKVMEPHIDRIIIASAEGLDQTVKLPSETDQYFARLQQAINTQPEAAAVYPDIAALIRRVHDKLERNPIELSFGNQATGTDVFLFQRFHLQAIASSMIADPQRGVSDLLNLYRALDYGVNEQTKNILSTILRRAGLTEAHISFDVMPFGMDVASGVSPARLERVQREQQSALLGSYLNYPMPQLVNLMAALDLGDGFRAAPVSDVPTLLLTGTLDGRTYPDEQRAAVRGLRNVTQVMVVNGGHNLFMVSPEVAETIHQFLNDEPLKTTEITVPLPNFAP